MDFVDINMGCPIDLVCDKGMGAALMGRTRKLRGIIAVRPCVRNVPGTFPPQLLAYPPVKATWFDFRLALVYGGE